MNQSTKNHDNVWDFQTFKNSTNAWQAAVSEIFPNNNNYEDWQKSLNDNKNNATKTLNQYGSYASQICDSANDYVQSTIKNTTNTAVYLAGISNKQANKAGENIKNNIAEYQQALTSWSIEKLTEYCNKNAQNAQNQANEYMNQYIESCIALQNNCWGQISDFLVMRERYSNSAFKVAKENRSK